MQRLIFSLCLFLCSVASAADRPNFVVVLIDDLGWSDFSCFGNQRVTTENIDRLAREGLRFTQFCVASPICSPSRVGLTTGQHPARWGITSFLAERQMNERRGMEQFLDRSAPTLARLLADAGYAAGHFGKWHMGGQRDVGEAPLITEYGFEASLTQFEGLGERVLGTYETIHQDQGGKRGLEIGSAKLGRGEVHWTKRYEVTAAFVDRAVEFIDDAAEEDRPFFVNVWPDDVHSPHEPPPALRGDGSKQAMYDGVLENMDDQLGPLFDRIRDDPELRDNTLILVTSDNGPEPGAGSAGDFRGHKGTLYEGGIRSPLVVWGPGLIEKEHVGKANEKSVISSLDLPPSLLRLADVDLPEMSEFDGIDQSEALLGRAEPVRDSPLMWLRPPDRRGPNGEWPDLAIRQGDWKLLVDQDGSGAELFDLASDPSESKNLAGEQPELTKRLTDAVLAWHKEVEADRNALRRKRAALPKPDISGGNVFVNSIAEGADPWVVRHEGFYYWCQSEGNRGVAVWKSDRLTELGERHVVWRAPETGPHSREIWAPELHFLDGRWYVYVAASNGRNENHRTIVLESEGDDPLGRFVLKSEAYTGDDVESGSNNRWAIDGTVLEHGGKRYLVWSGWENDRDEQWLYIAPMKNPWTLSGNRVRLCDNDDFAWERVSESTDERGLHEAPQVLQRNGRTFLVYSCSGSWEPTYKLGMLELRAGGDPMDPADWSKRPEPVFRSTDQTIGVGHCAFVTSPVGSEDWLVYHAKMDRRPGWRRAIFAQPFGWSDDGAPQFGEPVAAGFPVRVPSGQPSDSVCEAVAEGFENGLSRWSYYGHQQFVQLADGKLHLGKPPAEPVNPYRSGEKVVLRDAVCSDVTLRARITIVEGDRDAGLLFRVARPSVGYDAQRGYFFGVLPGEDRVILGYTDGRTWEELARADAVIEQGRTYELAVAAQGGSIAAFLDGRLVLRARDDRSPAGRVGLRVVDVHATFDDVQVNTTPASQP